MFQSLQSGIRKHDNIPRGRSFRCGQRQLTAGVSRFLWPASPNSPQTSSPRTDRIHPPIPNRIEGRGGVGCQLKGIYVEGGGEWVGECPLGLPEVQSITQIRPSAFHQPMHIRIPCFSRPLFLLAVWVKASPWGFGSISTRILGYWPGGATIYARLALPQYQIVNPRG